MRWGVCVRPSSRAIRFSAVHREGSESSAKDRSATEQRQAHARNKDAPAGYRTLHVGEFVPKGGQGAEKAIRIIESALIRAALAEGYDILNIKGTQTLVHTISSRGNREARRWLRSGTLKVERV
jgi:hypothetical protein